MENFQILLDENLIFVNRTRLINRCPIPKEINRMEEIRISVSITILTGSYIDFSAKTLN